MTSASSSSQQSFLLLIASSLAQHGASAQGVGGTRLEQHSFQNGLSFNNTLGSWTMLGAAIPTRGPMSLLPPVVDRGSLFMHKQPILTEDFEASFVFAAEGQSNSEHREGFGFWITDRDFSQDTDAAKRYMVEPASSVGRQLQDAKWDLWGFPRAFRGFGVLFSNFVGTHELTANYRPSVDVVIGDNSEKRPWLDVPSSRAREFDFRNTDVTVDVRYRRGQLTVDCTARGRKDNIYTGSANLRSPSYVGFSGHTGETYGQRKDTPVDHVQLKSLSMSNYDTGSRGEDAADPKFQHHANLDHEDFIHKYSSKSQEREESKTIVELTHVVNKLVSETEPMRHQMQHAIVTLTTKVQTLEDSVTKLKQTIQTTSGHKDLDAEFREMKKELFTLSNFASNQHSAQQDKLKQVHQDLAKSSAAGGYEQTTQMEDLVQQNEQLKRAIESGHSQTFWISLGVIALIAGAGFALYTKFKSWEKKHIL